jgi:hypothetical protein
MASSVEFSTSDDDLILPSAFWDHPENKVFIMKQGKNNGKDITPADAIRSIFNNGQKQTHLDCLMMMVAAQYKAMLDTFGDDAFNTMFPGGKGLRISHYAAPEGRAESTDSNRQTFDGKPLYTDQKAVLNIMIDPHDPTKDLLPGDWVYFSNVSMYKEMVKLLTDLVDEDVSVHQWQYIKALENGTWAPPKEYGTNVWQGEHAVYLGKGKFSGFGLTGEFNYDQIIAALFDSYMDVVNAYYNYPYFTQKFGNAPKAMKEKDIMMKMTLEMSTEKPQLAKIYRLNYSELSKLGK